LKLCSAAIWPEAQKQEFYRVMLSDTDRLTETVEQVLRAGRAGDKKSWAREIRSRLPATGARVHGRGAHPPPPRTGIDTIRRTLEQMARRRAF